MEFPTSGIIPLSIQLNEYCQTNGGTSGDASLASLSISVAFFARGLEAM